MKYLLTGMTLLLMLAADTKDTTQIIADNEAYRAKMNAEYADPKTSPLTEEARTTFTELPFFPIDTAFYVVAQFERTKRAKSFKMKTTTDRLPIYRPYGKATFWLKGKKCELNIYQSDRLKKMPEYKEHLFLPFTDNSNASTTYGGGRFIDLSIPKGKTIVIDFNKAYNPYCAYNHKYSCPIPPKENSLDVEVLAGVEYLDDH